MKDQFQKLIKNGAPHIMVGNFATKFVTFFGSLFLARLLSKSDLGVLSYMENLCSYAYLLMGLGMSNAILRYNIKSNNRQIQKGITEYSLRRGLICDFVLIVAVVSINLFYPHKDSFAIAKEMIPLLIIALPFQDIISMVQMNERSFFSNKRYAIVSLCSATAAVIGRLVGAYKGGVFGVVLGIVIANVIVAIIAGSSSYKKYYSDIDAVRVDTKTAKESSAYGLQYMITNGLWGFFMLIDIYLLGYVSGDPVTVADYKIAYSFPVNMALFSSAIGIFVASYFIKNETNPTWVRKYYKRMMGGGALILGAVGIALFVLAKPLIWLYGTQYYNVIPLMRLLIIGCFIETAFRFPTANILASIGKVKYNMLISAAGLVLEIVLDLLLIPKYGAYGIAYGSIVVRSLMAVALFIVFNRMYNIVGKRRNS